jgi:ankyrin repeat protein
MTLFEGGSRCQTKIHLLHSFLTPPTSSSPNPGNFPPPLQGKNKEDLLQNAVYNGRHLLVRHLVEQGICQTEKDDILVEYNMMNLACANGHLPVVRELIRAGADIDEKEKHRGYTPLYMACSVGHLPIAQELILAGAAVDKAIHIGWTPLMKAAQGGCLEVVKLLLQSGADVTKMSNAGDTALEFAERNGHTDVQALLFKQKGSILDLGH